MVIPILLMITILSSANISVSQLLLTTFIDVILLFLALWLFGKYILEPFLAEVVKSNSHEIFIGSVLFLVIGASTLAYSLGFSYSLGAFIAGMILAETKYKHQIEADLIPFRDLLLGVFFITVGMQIDFSVISNYFLEIIALLLLLTVVKIAIIFLLLLKKAGSRVALKTALALFQLGEFGLVVLELAKTNSIIEPTISQLLIVTITISMIITPFVLRNISAIANAILREDEPTTTSNLEPQNMHDHIIILGFGRLGRKISNKLTLRSVKHIAIEHNIKNVKDAQKEGKNVIFGNAASRTILESINIQDAAVVIVALDNSEKLHLICDVLSTVATNAKVVIKVDKFAEKEALIEEFPNFDIVVGTEQLARGMVDSMLRCDI